MEVLSQEEQQDDSTTPETPKAAKCKTIKKQSNKKINPQKNGYNIF